MNVFKISAGGELPTIAPFDYPRVVIKCIYVDEINATYVLALKPEISGLIATQKPNTPIRSYSKRWGKIALKSGKMLSNVIFSNYMGCNTLSAGFPIVDALKHLQLYKIIDDDFIECPCEISVCVLGEFRGWPEIINTYEEIRTQLLKNPKLPLPPPKPSALDLYKLESGGALDALRARLESELSSVAQEFDNLHAAVDVLAQKSDNLHAAVDVLTQKSDNLHTAVDVLDQSRLLHQEELGAFRAETGLSLGDAARDVRLLRSRVEEVRTALNVWGFIVSMVMLVFIVAFISQ